MAFAILPRHIEVYDKMPEEEKKLWYTAKEVAIAFPLYVWKKPHLDYLINSFEVRTRFFMTYTEDFINKMKDNYGYLGDFEYNCGIGSYYKVELRLYIEDVKKICSKGGYLYENKERIDRYDKVLPIEASYQIREGLLEFVNSKIIKDVHHTYITRFFNNEFPRFKVKFIENTPVMQLDDSNLENNTHRMFFGYMILHDYITKMFINLTGISKARWNTILAIYGARFFRRRDLVGVHGKQKFKWLLEEGYIKRVEFTFDSKYKFSGKFVRGYMYNATDKTLKLVRDYMDYLLLRKRLPTTGRVANDFGFGLKTKNDKRARYLDKEFALKSLENPDFTLATYISTQETVEGLYKSLFGYVNSKEFFNWIDDDTLTRLHEERIPFRFNRFIWEYSRESAFKKNEDLSYIKKFLSGDNVWNISTD